MYKNSYKIILNYLFLSIFLLFFTLSSFFSFIFITNSDTELNKYTTNQSNTNYLKVVDLYDIDNNQSITSFFKEKDSLERLKNMNAHLNTHFNYLEIYQQFLEIYDYYEGNPKFVYGYEQGQYIINEKINNHYVTALNAIQMNSNVIKQWNIAKSVDKGRIFTKKDYTLNKKIPVVLGFEYEEYYNINDKFKANFLGHDYIFEIIGFLKKNTSISIDNNIIDFDRSIVMPYFTCPLEVNNENDFQKRYYAQKNCGYIIYNNKIDVNEIKGTLYEISKNYNLLYDVIDEKIGFTNDRNNYFINLKIKQAIIGLSFILWLITVLLITMITIKYTSSKIQSQSSIIYVKKKVFMIIATLYSFSIIGTFLLAPFIIKIIPYISLKNSSVFIFKFSIFYLIFFVINAVILNYYINNIFYKNLKDLKILHRKEEKQVKRPKRLKFSYNFIARYRKPRQ